MGQSPPLVPLLHLQAHPQLKNLFHVLGIQFSGGLAGDTGAMGLQQRRRKRGLGLQLGGRSVVGWWELGLLRLGLWLLQPVLWPCGCQLLHGPHYWQLLQQTRWVI